VRKKSLSKNFVFFLPIFIIIVAITNDYFGESFLNMGAIRAIILLPFCLFFLTKNFNKTNFNIIILIFLCYMGILSAFTSNPDYTLYVFAKMFIASMMLPIGFYYIKTLDDLKKLTRNYFISIIIIIIMFGFSNYYSVGKESYKDSTVLFGESGVNITKSLALLLMTIPLFLYNNKSKRLLYFVLFVTITSLIVVTLGLKRTAIISLAVGYLIYFIFKENKSKSTQYAILIFIILIVSSPLYYDYLETRIFAREKNLNYESTDDMLEEWRYKETEIGLKVISDGNIITKLFGEELFNSFNYLDIPYMFHNDYITVLAGSGFVGLFFLLWIYLSIIVYFKKTYKVIKNNYSISKELRAVVFSIITFLIIISIGGSIHGIEIRALAFLYIGGVLGFSKQLMLEVLNENSIYRRY